MDDRGMWIIGPLAVESERFDVPLRARLVVLLSIVRWICRLGALAEAFVFKPREMKVTNDVGRQLRIVPLH